MTAPHRVWINFAKANQYFLAYEEPPRDADDCEDEYIRADLVATPMFKNPAASVMLSLAHLCADASRKGDRDEAARIAQLGGDLEALFPEAKMELDARYPTEKPHDA